MNVWSREDDWVAEGGCPFFFKLSLCLDDDLFTHEPVKAFSIQVRMTRWDLVAIFLLEPDFDEVFSLFHLVVGLEIVDNAQMVNVLATRWDKAMAISSFFLLKLLNQWICRRVKQINYLRVINALIFLLLFCKIIVLFCIRFSDSWRITGEKSEIEAGYFMLISEFLLCFWWVLFRCSLWYAAYSGLTSIISSSE